LIELLVVIATFDIDEIWSEKQLPHVQLGNTSVDFSPLNPMNDRTIGRRVAAVRHGQYDALQFFDSHAAPKGTGNICVWNWKDVKL
jgi:hypothetical protein